MTIEEAIAEVGQMHRVAGDFLQRDFTTQLPWTPKAAGAYATILNAVASGDLIPRADARLAIAHAYQRAADLVAGSAYTSNGDRRSLEPVKAGYEGADQHHATIAAAILALAPAEPLEGVGALKAERDEWKRLCWLIRSFAVHDDDCTINRHPRYRDCSCGLRAALTTPEKDTP